LNPDESTENNTNEEPKSRDTPTADTHNLIIDKNNGIYSEKFRNFATTTTNNNNNNTNVLLQSENNSKSFRKRISYNMQLSYSNSAISSMPITPKRLLGSFEVNYLFFVLFNFS
jgi:hypothetical protein